MDRSQYDQHFDFFSELLDTERQAIMNCAISRHFKKNSIIISADDDTDSLYIVESGQVRIYLSDARGREFSIRTVGPGEVFGELAVLAGGPRAANAVTLEDSALAMVSRSDFSRCLREHPDISFKIIESLVQRIREMTEDISTLALLDVYGRVARALTQSAVETDGKLLTPQMTHQEIANRVGSTREMVTRILRDLRSGDYITVRDKQYVLEKPLPPGW